MIDGIDWAERGWLPDWAIRYGIRAQLATRLATDGDLSPGERVAATRDLVRQLESSAIAIQTDVANQQHYEVPPEFFEKCLGPRLKYSCCYYPTGAESLAAAEEAMLRLTCERAELADGQTILELGCGWGSLSLWMAEQYPGSEILAVSNSRDQRRFIQARAAERGLENLRIQTANVAQFDPARRFDRVVSIEMFEHMRNYRRLLGRISDWLHEDGALFVHIFSYAGPPYLFADEGGDWMSRWFFSGGTMPSDDLLLHFQDDVTLAEQWRIDGGHYARTCDQWLERLDANYDALRELFAQDLGDVEGPRQLQRWRMFMMACGELFRYDRGRPWGVSHYRFAPRARRTVVDPPSASREIAV